MRTASSLSLILAVALVFAASVERSRAKGYPDECREGSGDLGIGLYICDGGDCTVSERLSGGRVAHRFSVEPRIREIDGKGPSAGKLKDNDILVAVDGSLITTFDGGYKLANAKIGVPIILRFRRNRQELEVKITPIKGCNLPKLTVIE